MEVFVGQVQSSRSVFGLLGTCSADDETGDAGSLLRFVQAEQTGLAAAADDQDLLTGLDQSCSLSGSACDVQSGQRGTCGHIVGQLRIDAGLEQDGLTLDVDLVDGRSHLEDLVDSQRGEGQGNQRSDLIAGLQVANIVVANLLDSTHQHAAGTGPGILVLTGVSDDFLHLVADRFHFFLGGNFRGLLVQNALNDLGEGSGVDVQGLNVDQNFVVPDLHVVVDDIRRLGQNSLGRDNSVSAVRIRCMFLHSFCPPYD